MSFRENKSTLQADVAATLKIEDLNGMVLIVIDEESQTSERKCLDTLNKILRWNFFFN